MSQTAEIKGGVKAPAFTLLDQNENKTSLKDYAGKWLVLYFYPKDDTPGCTTEACEFSDNLKSFDKLKAEVAGISPDSPASHAKFIARYKIKVRLLSDPDHKVMTKYGAWGTKKMYGRESEGVIRTTYLIDPKGRVAYVWRNVRAAGHAGKVSEKLAELAN